MLIKNNKISILIIYLFCMLSIFNCGSVYRSKVFDMLWQFLLVIITIMALPKLSKKYLGTCIDFSLIFSFCIFIFLILNYFSSPFNLVYYSIFFIIDPIMLLLFFMSSKSNVYSIFKSFENIAVVLSIISLFFLCVYYFGFSCNMSRTINWGGIRSIPGYFGIDYFSQGKITYLGISNVIRNTGLFDEAPMFSYVLCIALLIDLFICNHKQLMTYKTVILLITIISTTSSTGLIIALLSLLYKEYLLSNGSLRKLLILIVIPLFLSAIRIILDDKRGSINSELSSYNIRVDDIKACFYAWKNHLIIGNGLNNSTSIQNYMDYRRLLPNSNSSGLSTGFMTVLAQGGIMLALFYVIPTFLVSIKSLKMFGLALFSFILFIFTIVSDSFIYIILLSYFWSLFLSFSCCKYDYTLN